MASAKYLLAVFCAALVCASVGARELQQTSSTCSVKSYATAWSFNQAICRKAYNSTVVGVITHFCENPTDFVPSQILQIVEAEMKVAVTAIANAAVKMSHYATISPSCEPGSYADFYAWARAKAVAKSVAQSFVYAWSAVLGPDAMQTLGVYVDAQAYALAQTCETKYAQILGDYHICHKEACSSTSCPVKCFYWNDDCTTATAEAIADAFVSVAAYVEFYFDSEECGPDCEMAMCSYVCPDGC